MPFPLYTAVPSPQTRLAFPASKQRHWTRVRIQIPIESLRHLSKIYIAESGKIVKGNTYKIRESLRQKKCRRTRRARIFIFVGVGGGQVRVSLPVNFWWTHGKMFTVICLPVASTEAVNKSVGKGKKVNTTKGDKKLQQPEQEVGSTERYILSH